MFNKKYVKNINITKINAIELFHIFFFSFKVFFSSVYNGIITK